MRARPIGAWMNEGRVPSCGRWFDSPAASYSPRPVAGVVIADGLAWVSRLEEALGIGYAPGKDSFHTIPWREGPVDKAAFIARVEGIEPAGGTPLVASRLRSFEALGKIREGERIAILVTG